MATFINPQTGSQGSEGRRTRTHLYGSAETTDYAKGVEAPLELTPDPEMSALPDSEGVATWDAAAMAVQSEAGQSLEIAAIIRVVGLKSMKPIKSLKPTGAILRAYITPEDADALPIFTVEDTTNRGPEPVLNLILPVPFSGPTWAANGLRMTLEFSEAVRITERYLRIRTEA